MTSNKNEDKLPENGLQWMKVTFTDRTVELSGQRRSSWNSATIERRGRHQCSHAFFTDMEGSLGDNPDAVDELDVKDMSTIDLDSCLAKSRVRIPPS